MASTIFYSVFAFSLALTSLSAVAENFNRNDYLPLDVEYGYTVGDDVYTVRYERDTDIGEVRIRAYDSNGEGVEYDDLPRPKRPLISEEIKQALNKAVTADRMNKKHRVIVALNSPTIPIETPTSSSMRVENGKVVSLKQDNREVQKPPALAIGEQAETIRQAISNRRGVRLDKLNAVKATLATRHKWLESSKSEAVDNFSEHESLTLELTASQISELAERSSDLIEGIDLYKQGYDSVNSAMEATGVDPWATDYAGRDGDGLGIYMTETGCPNTNHITNYTRLGSPQRTDHSELVSGIIRAVSPESWLYCRGGGVLPRATDLDGVGGRPPIHIANVSWGRRDESSYQVLDRDWDNLVYNEGVAVFAGAGNTRDDNGSNEIDSPGKGYNVVTVGSFSDTNDWYSHFSSDKNPSAGQTKPDVLAPGENITAEGHTDSGTSFASPHAAGFAANLMSEWMQYAPAALKATFLASSTYNVGGVSQGTVGAEGLDFHNAYYGGQWHKWSGSNSSFGYFAANDGGSSWDDQFLEVRVDLTASMSDVRIVFAYLNRGSWAYQYPSSSWALGTSYAMRVRDPSGQTIASTDISWNDPYLMLEIDPTVTGTYNVMIERVGNNDYNANFIASLNVTW